MATNTVQYPDGRQEIINVPKAFSVGDVVAVTHRRDGGVVVQRVSPIQYDPIDGKITIYLGAVTSGQTLGYDVYVNETCLVLNMCIFTISFSSPPTSLVELLEDIQPLKIGHDTNSPLLQLVIQEKHMHKYLFLG